MIEGMKTLGLYGCSVMMMVLLSCAICAQQTVKDSTSKKYKNIVRYNLTGALLFGFNKYVVLGYERMLSPRTSVSINVGSAALPKVLAIETDSFKTRRESDRTGVNASIDYRFYLQKENKFNAPHGLYIGPYYSYNRFEDDQQWMRHNTAGSNEIISSSTFDINTFVFELGYQLLLWRRFTLDMVMVGPGVGFYKYKASFTGDLNLSVANKEQLYEALKQRITQRFPGMNFVFSDKNFDADGVIKTSDVGYRYIIHIGFCF
jgi:hypothetical protein